jgi:hypothetical protein
MNNISIEADDYIFVKNRTGSLTLTNQLVLPLYLDQCLINSDDNYQATASSFNSALSCLHINYMYLYSKLFLVENGFPTQSPSYIGNAENTTPTVLTVSNINAANVTAVKAAGSTVSFTFNNYLNNYNVSIPLASITTPQQLAYSYFNTITALNSGGLFPEGQISLVGSAYNISLTGIPAIKINNSYTTNTSDIFLTTSTYTSNSGDIQLSEISNFNDLVQFSFSSSASAGMDDLVDIQITKNTYTGKNVIFCAAKKQIYILTEYANTVELVYSSITLGYNRDIDFQDITSIVLYGDFLYIGDKHYNSIYKVDVSGFIRNNPINSTRFIVDRIIGGTGSGDTQFNAPEPQFVYNNQLYVFDRNNNYIKLYDLNLNFLKGINYSNTLRSTPPITTTKPFNIGLYQGTYNIYYLSSYVTVNSFETFRTNEILILDINTLLQLYEIKLSFNNVDETLVDFKQSVIDIRTVYVATNKNLYKLFLSNFSQIGNFTQGIYNIKRLGDVNNDNLDALFVYQTYGKGFFTKFLEQNSYISLLTQSDFEIYSLSELFVNSNENQTFVVYNKTFKKLFYNFFKLLTNIKSRPVYIIQTNTPFNSRTFTDLEYISNAEFDELNTLDNKNFYVGENEIFSNSVINRIITNFYRLLQRGLQIASNKVTFEYSPINLKRVVNSIVAPVSTSTVTSYPYIMTEQYNQNDYTTFNSIILTEDGKGITTESDQKPTTKPQSQLIVTENKTEYVNTAYSFIDNNTSIKSPTLNLPLTNTNVAPTVVTYLEAVRTPETGNFNKKVIDYYKITTAADYIEYLKFVAVNNIRPLPPPKNIREEYEKIIYSDPTKFNNYTYIDLFQTGFAPAATPGATGPNATYRGARVLIIEELQKSGEYDIYKLDLTKYTLVEDIYSFQAIKDSKEGSTYTLNLRSQKAVLITNTAPTVEVTTAVKIDPNLLVNPGGGQGTGTRDTTELAVRRPNP